MFAQVRRRSAPILLCRRHSTSAPIPQHAIYISNSTNPYFNLTFEDWLFRHKPASHPLLFIYRDAPCVVLGRNQNPWKEVNMRVARSLAVPVIRRRSGGGTVYHDLGNTNFSIHLPRAEFDRSATAQVVLRAVRSLGVDAEVNERNDICVGKRKMSSAYKIVNTRAYHHGTMLISTELGALGDLLRVTGKDTMISKGVSSVSSPVCNLQQNDPSATHLGFTEAVIREWKQAYGVDESPHIVDETPDLMDIPYIRTGMAELPTWDWTFGQTPEFTYTLRKAFDTTTVSAEINSKHGIVTACSITTPTGTLDRMARALVGKRYACDVSDEDLGLSGEVGETEKEVWRWLRDAME